MARPATTYRGNRRRAEKLAQKARQPTDRKKAPAGAQAMSTESDLFGGSLPVEKGEPLLPTGAAAMRTTPALSGSGPKGETCRTCQYATRIGGYSKTFYKCGRTRESWTSSERTDIKLRWPACSEWSRMP